MDNINQDVNEIPEMWRQYIRLAEIDLSSAKLLGSTEHKLWEPAVYHCEQAAEKAVSALLALHGENPRQKRRNGKWHDVGFLLEQLEQYEQNLNDLIPKADELSNYATEYRYGKAVPPPPLTQEIVDKAISDAELFVSRANVLFDAFNAIEEDDQSQDNQSNETDTTVPGIP